MRLELKRALGTSVRSYRLLRDLPQEGLGPSQPYISNLEAGRGSASLEKIEQMAEVLGIHSISLIAAAYITSTEGLSAEDLLDQIRTELKVIGL
ncbi:helix-turn-helix domain-containing protein [Pseudomonas sp. MWU16-30317]|jgi:transcriptional regulator with XRE-family HTH domain|uniref:helix-turn-helix domain-containing protein n=1 Tax=Pseudomonas sp. MWU16-30317 TaxID=2878095 RepID=UPI001CFB08EE|nr:helix-turn-helix domain-containing protein [Pseudomonas sp. MWU16-30317]